MDLEELLNQRKWYDFTERIKEEITKGIDENKAQEMTELLLRFISKIHPLSITSTISMLFPCLNPKKGISLIDTAISTIFVSSVEEATYSEELVSLKLLRIKGCIILSEFEDIESQLIALKNTNISHENLKLLMLVTSFYYESIGNMENAQEYLFKYAKGNSQEYKQVKEEYPFKYESIEFIEKLMILSILSKTFFDFSAISSFVEFSHCKNENLKSLFIQFQEGEISEIDPKTACSILGVQTIDFLTEKIFLINILKMCFKSESKFVYFDHLMDFLKMEEQSVIRLLMRALGLKVIDGWIDSEKRIFYFNSVLPRALTKEELQRMKSKFMEWKSRVERVLEAMQ